MGKAFLLYLGRVFFFPEKLSGTKYSKCR